ncbi:MAG: hypothetical protein AVDCRST_MAG09-1862 [uncultured Sphingomonas sp.]|uniref:Peptidase M10 serralysin C-terminal domain-containing protein n=1 Tax=uncultured Sphingomonas sp. TaxID=158754 RepID=A0A6J4TBV5_9SPHN|nr:MAG: hypothetical protein AVDCRST_MAG09-1862 [uncultured Sphingomonas sp.]
MQRMQPALDGTAVVLGTRRVIIRLPWCCWPLLGAGGDRFVFRTGDLAGTAPGSCDVIRDYSYASGDRLRLDLFDANSNLAGTQDFAFIGAGAFTGVAGQLRYEQANGNTFVSADTDGDGDADFMLQLEGLHTLRSADFIL